MIVNYLKLLVVIYTDKKISLFIPFEDEILVQKLLLY